MRRIKGSVALAVLLGIVGFWTAFAQSSPDLVSVDKVGWWTRRPGAMAYGNANLFEVAAGVQGDESVAALRVLIRGDITKATLTLAESDAPLAQINPGKLRVCTTSVPWLVTDGGAFADAPKADCSRAVELTRTADVNNVGAWTGDVTAMLAGARSETSLMVVPSPDPAAVVPPTYYIKLAARIDAEGTSDAPPPTTPPEVAPVIPSSGGGGGATTLPHVTPATGTTATPVTAPAGGTTTPTTAPKRFALASAPKEVKHWGRLFWLLPLAAIGGALFTGGRKYWEQRLAAGAT